MRRKLTAAIALTTTACTTWRVQPAPAPVAEAAAPDGQSGSRARTRLMLRSGASMELYDVAVVGDSVIGMNAPASYAERQRIAVAAADVRSFAVRKISPVRTVLAVAAIGLAAATIIGGLSGASSSSSSSNQSCESTA